MTFGFSSPLSAPEPDAYQTHINHLLHFTYDNASCICGVFAYLHYRPNTFPVIKGSLDGIGDCHVSRYLASQCVKIQSLTMMEVVGTIPA